VFFFSSRRRHTRLVSDWSSDVCSSDLPRPGLRRRGRGKAALKPSGNSRMKQGTWRHGAGIMERKIWRRGDLTAPRAAPPPTYGRSEERRVREKGRKGRGEED